MAVVHLFYTRDRSGESESFALARDVITDDVFVIHGKGRKSPETDYTEDQLSVRDFLQGNGSEQRALLDLIGTLVVEA